MALFRYTAVSRSGKTVRGALEADSRRQAAQMLGARGLTPLELKSNGRGGGAPSTAIVGRASFFRFSFPFSNAAASFLAPPRKAVAAVTRQLATLLNAGIPLDGALTAICSQRDSSRIQRTVASLKDMILEGKSFADSLAQFPEAFSPTYVTMIRAAEASGTLEPVMERLAENMEQQDALVRKVRSAMAYPVLMLLVGAGIVFFLLTFVVPQVTQVFLDFKRDLPFSTKFLIAAGDIVEQYWHVLLITLLFCVFGLWRFCRSARGRDVTHRMALRLPLLRSLYRPLVVGQVTRTLGMLLKHGVNLVQALYIARTVSGNVLASRAMERMHAEVQEGKELAVLMDDALLFTPLERQMVAAGEKSGQLAEMLLWVAKDCDDQVSSRLQMLTALLEPFMILLLGGVVGFVVIAIILPIFQMSTLLG